jgi:hypothetical protein
MGVGQPGVEMVRETYPVDKGCLVIFFQGFAVFPLPSTGINMKYG